MTSDDEAVEAVHDHRKVLLTHRQTLTDDKVIDAIDWLLDALQADKQWLAEGYRRMVRELVALEDRVAIDRVRSRPVSGTERLMCTEHEDRKAVAYTARCAECSRGFMAPGSGTEPDTAREREAYESGRHDRARAIVAMLRDESEPTPPEWLRVADAIERRFLAGFSVDAGKQRED